MKDRYTFRIVVQFYHFFLRKERKTASALRIMLAPFNKHLCMHTPAQNPPRLFTSLWSPTHSSPALVSPAHFQSFKRAVAPIQQLGCSLLSRNPRIHLCQIQNHTVERREPYQGHSSTWVCLYLFSTSKMLPVAHSWVRALCQAAEPAPPLILLFAKQVKLRESGWEENYIIWVNWFGATQSPSCNEGNCLVFETQLETFRRCKIDFILFLSKLLSRDWPLYHPGK